MAAVVLAGAKNAGKLEEVSDASHEALISIMGRPMVHYVIDALKASESIDRIVLVGPVDPLKVEGEFEGVDLVQSGSSMVENIQIGIDHLGEDRPVLVVTSDIPLLVAEAVDDFISRTESVSADLYYPIIAKEINDERYPGVRRTYVRLKDGIFTGGNLALVEPEIVPACREVFARAVALRKKPWKLSRLLGFAFIFKLLFNRLTLQEIEARVETVLGFRGVAVITPYPEMGIDVDKPDDFQLVEKLLRERDSKE